jgi:molybdate transport system substrate-binding protein
VFAAASLKDAFTSIARDYESGHAGILVQLTFAGSQTLAAQIAQGAPADVFASAALKDLQQANPDPSSIRVFALNRLTIVERAGWNGIHSAKDLAAVPKLVLADNSVPAGHYAGEFLAKAAKIYGEGWQRTVESHVVSRELDVRAVLAKVKLGEADAGIVYETDANSAEGQVTKIEIPDSLNLVAQYPVGLFPKSANADVGRDFLKYLFLPQAQAELQKQGFISPISAANEIVVVAGTTERIIHLPLASNLHQVTLHVVGRNGVKETIKGVSIVSVLGPLPGTVTFIASDGYSKTFKGSDLGPDMAAFVREPDGNYRIIVQGFKPSWWIRWIRRIELK